MSKLLVVHKKIFAKTYSASKFSFAYLWHLISCFLIVFVTLIITISSQNLWNKTNIYLEQPSIEFTNKILFILSDKSNLNNFYLWSSFDEFNMQNLKKLLLPTIKIENIDQNNDGKTDEIIVNINFNLLNANDTFQIYNVFYMLEFTANLNYRVNAKIKSEIFGYLERLQPCKELSIKANLKVLQKQILPSTGTINNYNQNHILYSQTDKIYDLFNKVEKNNINQNIAETIYQKIMEKNFNQNFGLELANSIENWKFETASTKISNFNAQFHFIITEQMFIYRCSALELLKWAWIQYFGVLVIVRHIIKLFSSFLYENQILQTIVNCEKIKIN